MDNTPKQQAVTREDFERASTFGILPKLIDRLFTERDEALKHLDNAQRFLLESDTKIAEERRWKEAYREVALKLWWQRADVDTEEIDAEAKRLLERSDENQS